MSEWYIVYNGQQVGPMSKEQLLSYGLNPQSKVWREGMAEWADVFTIPELMELCTTSVQSAPATVQYVAPQQPERKEPLSGKSKVVCGILAILLGSFGVQYFYINKAGAGILSFLLIWVFPTVIFFLTCGGGFFLYSLSFLLAMMYLAQGIEMMCLTDEDFDRRFAKNPTFWPFF